MQIGKHAPQIWPLCNSALESSKTEPPILDKSSILPRRMHVQISWTTCWVSIKYIYISYIPGWWIVRFKGYWGIFQLRLLSLALLGDCKRDLIATMQAVLYWPSWVCAMRSASTVAAAVAALEAAAGFPPGWDEVEDAEDEVEEPWITRLSQGSTLEWLWNGVEVIRPCRRNEPSSSDADDVSVIKITMTGM